MEHLIALIVSFLEVRGNCQCPQDWNCKDSRLLLQNELMIWFNHWIFHFFGFSNLCILEGCKSKQTEVFLVACHFASRLRIHATDRFILITGAFRKFFVKSWGGVFLRRWLMGFFKWHMGIFVQSVAHTGPKQWCLVKPIHLLRVVGTWVLLLASWDRGSREGVVWVVRVTEMHKKKMRGAWWLPFSKSRVWGNLWDGK